MATVGWEDKIFDYGTQFEPIKPHGTRIIHSHTVMCPKTKQVVPWSVGNQEGKGCDICEYNHWNSHNGVYCGYKKGIKRD